MGNKIKVIICDLDGTLSLFERTDKSKPNYRNPYSAEYCENDFLNHVVYEIIKGKPVILVSGRQEKHRPQTERWLKKYGIEYLSLHLRQNGDVRSDSVVKREIYNKLIKPFFDVNFVLDDRNSVVSMWRDEGLICLQVNDGDF